MIEQDDIEFHLPPNIDYKFAETNYFVAMIPEERILATFYTVTRKSIGVCLADVAVFGCLSENRAEMLYLDSQQQLPAPERLSRFETPTGLKILVKSPREYTLDYVGFDNTEAHLSITGLHEPFDIHDPNHSPKAVADEHGRVEGSGLGKAYGNHFDLTCRVVGTLTLRGKTYPIDCISTMDHSWGERCEVGLRPMGWTNANFGADYGLHWIHSVDFTKPADQQHALAHGYAVENGEVYGFTDLEMHTNRLGAIGVAIDIEATDVRGKKHVVYGTPLVGAPWSCYTSTMLYVAMTRWISDHGRIGYGISMENHPLDTMARLRGRRWNQAPGTIGT